MKEEYLIRVDSLAKKFCRDLKTSLRYGAIDLLQEFTGFAPANRNLRKKEFWALKDISFAVKRGECLGLVGRNGCGKSTLLSILNGTIKPDGGRVEMKGRINALIQLGAGFNPILTGRENVFINGQVLGFSKKEIADRYDEIVEFAELKEFMETPVRNYSSGMKVRLGFSVAAQLEPDVLLLDEVMAVGDVGFRVKCINRITEIIDNAAVILVSHSMPQIARVCSHVLMLDNGVVSYFGNDVPVGIEKYYQAFSGGHSHVVGSGVLIKDIRIYSTTYLDSDVSKVKYGEDMFIEIGFIVKTDVGKINIGIPIFDIDQKNIAATGLTGVHVEQSVYKTLKISIPQNMFNSGSYFINLFFNARVNGKPIVLTQATNIHQFQVAGSVHSNHAPFQLMNSWELVQDGS